MMNKSSSLDTPAVHQYKLMNVPKYRQGLNILEDELEEDKSSSISSMEHNKASKNKIDKKNLKLNLNSI